MTKQNDGAKAAAAEAKSADEQGDPTGSDNATGIPADAIPEGPLTLLEGATVKVPDDTPSKKGKKVGVARQSANTWWCDNCDTGNMVTTGESECGGCGGIATLPFNK